jgi:hypothetical protein
VFQSLFPQILTHAFCPNKLRLALKALPCLHNIRKHPSPPNQLFYRNTSLQSLRFCSCMSAESRSTAIQCGAVSGSVHTVYCLLEVKQSKMINCVEFNVIGAFGGGERGGAVLLLVFPVNGNNRSCRNRCGVQTANPVGLVRRYVDCSSTDPFFGKSLAARTFSGATCFKISTARRAEMHTISCTGPSGTEQPMNRECNKRGQEPNREKQTRGTA